MIVRQHGRPPAGAVPRPRGHAAVGLLTPTLQRVRRRHFVYLKNYVGVMLFCILNGCNVPLEMLLHP